MYENRVDWDDLTDGAKIVVIMELREAMMFHDAAFFIRLDHNGIHKFIKMITAEVDDHEAEFARIVHATTRKINLLKSGRIYQAKEEWDDFIEREIHGERPYTPLVAFIRKREIEKAKAFILDFKFREEIPNYNPNSSMVAPRFDTVQRVIRRLDCYVYTDATENFIRFAIDLLDEYSHALGYAEGYRDARMDLNDQRGGGAQIRYTHELDIYHALWAEYNRSSDKFAEPGVPRQHDAQDKYHSIPAGSARSVHSYIPANDLPDPDALFRGPQNKGQAVSENNMKQFKKNFNSLTSFNGDDQSDYNSAVEHQLGSEYTLSRKRKGTPYPRLLKSIEDKEYDDGDGDSDYEPEPAPKKQKTSSHKPVTPKPSALKNKIKTITPKPVPESLANNMGGRKVSKNTASLTPSRLRQVLSHEDIPSPAPFVATSESTSVEGFIAPAGGCPVPTGSSTTSVGGFPAPVRGSPVGSPIPVGSSTCPAGGSPIPVADAELGVTNVGQLNNGSNETENQTLEKNADVQNDSTKAGAAFETNPEY